MEILKIDIYRFDETHNFEAGVKSRLRKGDNLTNFLEKYVPVFYLWTRMGNYLPYAPKIVKMTNFCNPDKIEM